MRRYGLSLIGVIGLLAAVMAAAAVWLLLTDPVSVAGALNEQEIMPTVLDLADVVLELLRELLRYL